MAIVLQHYLLSGTRIMSNKMTPLTLLTEFERITVEQMCNGAKPTEKIIIEAVRFCNKHNELRKKHGLKPII